MILVFLVPLFKNDLVRIGTNLCCDKFLEITHSIFGTTFDTRLLAQSIIDFHFDKIVLGNRLGRFLGLIDTSMIQFPLKNSIMAYLVFILAATSMFG